MRRVQVRLSKAWFDTTPTPLISNVLNAGLEPTSSCVSGNRQQPVDPLSMCAGTDPSVWVVYVVPPLLGRYQRRNVLALGTALTGPFPNAACHCQESNPILRA